MKKSIAKLLVKEIIKEVLNQPGPEDKERSDLISQISDDYKDIYGMRPRGQLQRMATAPIEELRAWAKQLSDEIQADIESKRRDDIEHQSATQKAMTPKKWNVGDVTGLEEIYMPAPEHIVEYVKPFPGAKPFTIEDSHGPQKFEVCVGKLGNGKLGLAIYAYRGDFAITVDWFNELYGNSL